MLDLWWTQSNGTGRMRGAGLVTRVGNRRAALERILTERGHLEDLGVDESLILNFRRRIKSRLPFAGIIRRLSYSTRFQDKG